MPSAPSTLVGVSVSCRATAVWLSASRRGDAHLVGAGLRGVGGAVQGAVQIALFEPVVVDEGDVADPHSGQRLDDDAADATEPDDADP